MWLIAALIIIGVLFLVAELVLIPGLSVAGIAALMAYGAAVWVAFSRYDTRGGLIAIGIIIVVSIVAVSLSLRARTWERFSLKNNIEGSSQEFPQQNNVSVGDRGVAISRLAPMGKVEINGRTYEAKSIDAYIDQNSRVEVTDFDNFNVIVKKLN